MSETPAFTVLVDGVDVGFRASTSGQLVLMQKILRDAHRSARKVGEAVALTDMMVKLLDITENMIILDEDIDHVADAMVRGKFNMAEMMTIIRQGRPVDDDTQDDADPVKPSANKSRTKKN